MSMASLAMYDFPSTKKEWAHFYALIRDQADSLPEKLVWGKQAYEWGGDVALAMTCGAPLRNHYAGHLHVIGALDFGLDQAGFYHSVLLGEIHKPRLRIAVNDLGSQSGYHAWRGVLGAQDFDIIISGSHWRSMEMVEAGEAEACAVDAVSYKFILKDAPHLANLPKFGKSAPAPSLPIVTSHEDWIEPLAGAINAAIAKASPSLGIVSFERMKLEDYLSVPNFDS